MGKVVVVGSLNQDLIFSTMQFPAPGETRLGEFSACLGGKGLNQAVACHRMEVDTHFITAMGADSFADNARAFLSDENLAFTAQVHQSTHTGAASIVVDGHAENLIVVAPGANAALGVEFMNEQEQLIAQADVLLVQLEVNISAVQRALEIATENQVFRICNPAPIREDVPPGLWQMVDLVTPNESEFSHYLKQHFQIEPQPDFWFEPEEQLHEWCNAWGVENVIITLGQFGCFVSRLNDIENAYRVLPPETEAKDTTGAGDAFSGALAAALSQNNQDIRSAVKQAVNVSALSVETVGTTPSFPTLSRYKERF